MGIQIDFVRANKVLDYITQNNIEDKTDMLGIIDSIINRLNFNDYNLKHNYMVEIMKKINCIINENSLIISVETFRELMSKKQNEFVLRYSTYIYNVWKIFYNQFDEFTYPVDSISHLYQAIVKIESKDKENNYLIFGNVDSINLQIGYLKSYFEKLEKKINTS